MKTFEARKALTSFLATEAAGGVVMVLAIVVALVWANSPWDGGYRALWSTELVFRVGQHHLDLDLRGWVNEGLMALFFLVAGLEIKRELVEGELRDPRKAMLPIVAALGGMVGSGLVYAAFNTGGRGGAGWGIPMATDIALVLGVLALLGERVPQGLKLFLLTLAIVDDIGSIAVIAVFSSNSVDPAPLVVAACLFAAALAMRRLGVHWTPAYVAVGAAAWLALHDGGVSGTVAGVVMGLLAPTDPAMHAEQVAEQREEMLDVSSPPRARATVRIARHSISQVEWLEYALHPWASYLIVPVFALANAGIRFGDVSFGTSVVLGVVAAKLIGKTVGVSAFSWLACRLRIARLPDDVGWPDLAGGAVLTGIGFAVSILLADLSLSMPAARDEAKLGVLLAAVVAAVIGSFVLVGTHRTNRAASQAVGTTS